MQYKLPYLTYFLSNNVPQRKKIPERPGQKENEPSAKRIYDLTRNELPLLHEIPKNQRCRMGHHRRPDARMGTTRHIPGQKRTANHHRTPRPLFGNHPNPHRRRAGTDKKTYKQERAFSTNRGYDYHPLLYHTLGATRREPTALFATRTAANHPVPHRYPD